MSPPTCSSSMTRFLVPFEVFMDVKQALGVATFRQSPFSPVRLSITELYNALHTLYITNSRTNQSERPYPDKFIPNGAQLPEPHYIINIHDLSLQHMLNNSLCVQKQPHKPHLISKFSPKMASVPSHLTIPCILNEFSEHTYASAHAPPENRETARGETIVNAPNCKRPSSNAGVNPMFVASRYADVPEAEA